MRVPKSFPAAMWRILRRSVGTNAEAGFLYNEILRGAQQRKSVEALSLFVFVTLADYFKSERSIRLSERVMQAWEIATAQEPIAHPARKKSRR